MSSSIRFLLELSQKIAWPPELAVSALVATDQGGDIISAFDASGTPSAATYWSNWGGSYDTPDVVQLQIFFDGFLQQVGSVAVLLATANSFMVSGTTVYTNTPIFPWLYPSVSTEVSTLEGFSSSHADPLKPSDKYYDSNGAKIPYPARLSIPSSSFRNRLPDTIYGISLFPTFSAEIQNHDGKYDLAANTNYFNTPMRIRKSVAVTPTLDDFKTVRYGLVDNVESDAEKMSVTGADIFRTLDDEVCRVFTEEEYPDAESAVIGKKIPVAFGPIVGAPLVSVDTNTYIVCDPGYLDTVSAVYDEDGTSISFTQNADGTITATGGKTCDFTGVSDNRIGQIITSELQAKSNIAYAEGPWDKVETDEYINLSARIAIFFGGGKVKDLVTACLRNDSAFLLQKNDGRLTLRQWGKSYGAITIPSWLITKSPRRSHMEQKYFASSIIVQYGYKEDVKDYAGTVLNSASEATIGEKWRKKQRQTLPPAGESRIVEKAAAEYLSSRLLDRFGGRPEQIRLAVGMDTSEITPLDTVNLDVVVNGRRFSTPNKWIVLEVNPAQDELLLEAVGEVTSNDGELSAPSTSIYDGLLSMVGSESNDAILGQPSTLAEV